MFYTMHKRTFLKALGAGLFAWPATVKGGAGHFGPWPENRPYDGDNQEMVPRKIALIVFDNLTLLDLVGFYDPLARLRSMGYLPDLTWELCALEAEVRDNHGFLVRPDQVRPDLSGYDAIFVPGGFGTRPLQHDRDFVEWLRQARGADYHISVCTGALLLGAAGFLEGRRATTNASEYETLASYCGEVVREKVVVDGKVLTAGGVSSSLDLGLYCCEKWAGGEARREIQKRMDYRCYP